MPGPRSDPKGLLLAVVGLLAGCTTPAVTMPPGPPAYRVGFHDGCDAGYAYAGSPFYGAENIVEPLQLQEPYLSGWQAGFDRCRASYQRIQRTVAAVFGPP